MREPSTPCTVEHRLRPPHFYLAEPVGRRSNAQNPLWATGQTPFRAAYCPRGSPYPENCTRPSHLSPKNNACEKCGLDPQRAPSRLNEQMAPISFRALPEKLTRQDFLKRPLSLVGFFADCAYRLLILAGCAHGAIPSRANLIDDSEPALRRCERSECLRPKSRSQRGISEIWCREGNHPPTALSDLRI